MTERSLEGLLRSMQKRLTSVERRMSRRPTFPPLPEPDPPLPMPIWNVRNGGSPVGITAAEAIWQSTTGMDFQTFGPLPRPMLVRASFGAQLICPGSGTYGMIGVYMDDPDGVRLEPEYGSDLIGGGSGRFGYTPFTYSTTSTHLHGTKDFVVPEGGASTFRFVVRRNGTTNTPTVAYPMLEIMPIRWL